MCSKISQSKYLSLDLFDSESMKSDWITSDLMMVVTGVFNIFSALARAFFIWIVYNSKRPFQHVLRGVMKIWSYGIDSGGLNGTPSAWLECCKKHSKMAVRVGNQSDIIIPEPRAMRNKDEECLIVSIVSSMKDGDHVKSV